MFEVTPANGAAALARVRLHAFPSFPELLEASKSAFISHGIARDELAELFNRGWKREEKEGEREIEGGKNAIIPAA